MEERIYKTLIERGLTPEDASRDAYLYVTAWIKGEVEPETMEMLGAFEV
jgi:hypothetical protein